MLLKIDVKQSSWLFFWGLPPLTPFSPGKHNDQAMYHNRHYPFQIIIPWNGTISIFLTSVWFDFFLLRSAPLWLRSRQVNIMIRLCIIIDITHFKLFFREMGIPFKAANYPLHSAQVSITKCGPTLRSCQVNIMIKTETQKFVSFKATTGVREVLLCKLVTRFISLVKINSMDPPLWP